MAKRGDGRCSGASSPHLPDHRKRARIPGRPPARATRWAPSGMRSRRPSLRSKPVPSPVAVRARKGAGGLRRSAPSMSSSRAAWSVRAAWRAASISGGCVAAVREEVGDRDRHCGADIADRCRRSGQARRRSVPCCRGCSIVVHQTLDDSLLGRPGRLMCFSAAVRISAFRCSRASSTSGESRGGQARIRHEMAADDLEHQPGVRAEHQLLGDKDAPRRGSRTAEP